MRVETGQFWGRTAPLWRALLNLAAFSLVGGVGAAMLTGEPLAGVLAYYALALVGLCSPEGAVLRLVFRRSPRREIPPLNATALPADQ